MSSDAAAAGSSELSESLRDSETDEVDPFTYYVPLRWWDYILVRRRDVCCCVALIVIITALYLSDCLGVPHSWENGTHCDYDVLSLNIDFQCCCVYSFQDHNH